MISPQHFTRLGVKETGITLQKVVNQVTDINRSSYLSSSLSITVTKALLQGMSCARTSVNGSLPQTHLSITTPHPMLITVALPGGAPKGTHLQLGKQPVPCYGFTENVRTISLSGSWLLLIAAKFVAGSGKSILRWVFPAQLHLIELT